MRQYTLPAVAPPVAGTGSVGLGSEVPESAGPVFVRPGSVGSGMCQDYTFQAVRLQLAEREYCFASGPAEPNHHLPNL